MSTFLGLFYEFYMEYELFLGNWWRSVWVPMAEAGGVQKSVQNAAA
jgi:hypothetical protein